MKLRAVQQTGGEDVVAGYEPEGDMVEAKYERGASDYGKMSIRNKRAVGYGGNAAPPEERRKAHAERMKKHKGVTEATRYAKETGKSFKSGKPVVKGGTAKDDKAFQYVAKKTFPNSKHILVDFPHQLCRSAIFLGYSFPESQIFSIHDQETLEEYFSDKKYRDKSLLGKAFNLLNFRHPNHPRKMQLISKTGSNK